ncbi:MAG: T9SS type A sorting domain-containing protein [bacterium]
MKKTILISITVVIFLFTNSFAQEQRSGNEINYKQSTITEKQIYSGSLWGFGYNSYSELGDGTTVSKQEPIQIGNDYDWITISCGYMHTFAIKRDGSLWGCGTSRFGDGLDNSYYSTITQIGLDRNWKYISTNEHHRLAIKNDGSLWSWGENHNGILGDSTLELEKVYTTPLRIEKTWNDVIFVSAGVYQSAAIREGGSLFMWGVNIGGQLGDGTRNSSDYPVKIGKSNEWSTVSCGRSNTLAIKKDGTLWAWGNNLWGASGTGKSGDMIFEPVKVGADSNWVSVSTCWNHSLGLKSDGTLWAWGSNLDYGLGDSTKSQEYYPKLIGKESDWIYISAEETINSAIKRDGSLWRWGAYLAVENRKEFKVPTKVEDISAVTQVDCGEHHAMFIRNHVIAKPTVSTLPIKNTTYNTAESGGNIISDGGDAYVTRGVCYSTSPEPTLKNSITKDGYGPGEYQSKMKNLKSFQTYYVRAYATNELGTVYGQEEIFTAKLPTPILISPENAKTDVPTDVSLKWNAVDNALKYRVQLATNPAFDTPLVDEETAVQTYDYNKYANDSIYYWRVQAVHEEVMSDWSDVWEFTTHKFNPQVLLSPAKDTINVPVDCKLVWKKNSANTTYILQVSKFPKFSQKVIDIDIADTVHQSSILESFTTYFWRVSAVIGEDQSDWSPIWKFTTLIDSVKLTTPTDLSKNLNTPINMSWLEGIYKKDYRLQISKTNDFATLKTDTLILKINNAEMKNLNYWQKYFWRVRNESGDTLGYWSEIWQFETRLREALLIYPADNQTGLGKEVNFRWNSADIDGAEYYQLQISKNDSFTDLVYSRDSITSTEQNVPDLEKDVLYYWRVRVWNIETIGTAYWSEVRTFRTGTSGVKDEADVIQIIPNPAGDFITVALKPSEGFEPSEGSAIQIYNTFGERVLSVGTGRDLSVRINIAALPKGIYFVKIGCETAKFVKM